MTFRVRLSRSARRALTSGLPPAAAGACAHFLAGALSENPHRVGKALRAPFEGHHVARRGEYRIRYVIDDDARTVDVLAVRHRRDAYRS